jgi:hypothetical protein
VLRCSRPWATPRPAAPRDARAWRHTRPRPARPTLLSTSRLALGGLLLRGLHELLEQHRLRIDVDVLTLGRQWFLLWCGGSVAAAPRAVLPRSASRWCPRCHQDLLPFCTAVERHLTYLSLQPVAQRTDATTPASAASSSPSWTHRARRCAPSRRNQERDALVGVHALLPRMSNARPPFLARLA